jgi:hypothetical protein
MYGSRQGNGMWVSGQMPVPPLPPGLRAYKCTHLGAHTSLECKLGDSFCCPSLLFPSLGIFVGCPSLVPAYSCTPSPFQS